MSLKVAHILFIVEANKNIKSPIIPKLDGINYQVKTSYKLVIAGGLAYAFGIKPYFRVLGA